MMDVPHIPRRATGCAFEACKPWQGCVVGTTLLIGRTAQSSLFCVMHASATNAAQRGMQEVEESHCKPPNRFVESRK